MTYFLCGWSKLTCFLLVDSVLCGHRNVPGFCVGGRNSFNYVGDQNFLASVQGSGLTCFSGGGRNPVGYCVWIEIDLVLVSGYRS